jgi:hypothetical protein
MRIYIFKSDAKRELRAFAGDVAGSRLPEQFRPWHLVGPVGPDKDPPHNRSRPSNRTSDRYLRLSTLAHEGDLVCLSLP